MSAMAFPYWIPPEIWAKVFETVSEEARLPRFSYFPPRNDLKNVRLTCKVFEELASPFLLPRIICGPLSSSLATLTAVSRHSVFSRSVKEVVYVCNRYHFIETFEEYKETFRREESFFGRFGGLTSDEGNQELMEAFAQYGEAYHDQTTVETSGEVIACLCSALMRMPHLEKVTISPKFPLYLDGPPYSRYFLEPDAAYNEAFLLMARVLSLTDTKVRELVIEMNNARGGRVGFAYVAGFNGELFRGMSPANLNHCCNAFRSLRSVTITAYENGIDGWMTGNLAKILSAAADLETLRVNFISTRYLPSATAWSRLTSLHLSYTTLDQGDLLDLLRRHSGTLKDISFRYVSITNGSWKVLLEGMKASLSLQRISIYDATEEDDDVIYLDQKALENYLLRDGPHPLSD